MRPYRTLLEQKIKERRMTLEEFAAYAENFAREHGEPGTLSLRHLQRLVAGKGPKGQPLGPIRPATARLLERIFETGSSELLTTPMQAIAPPGDDADELRERIQKSRRVDAEMLQGIRDQLNSIRRIDRQYGAIVTHADLLGKICQCRDLISYSLTGHTRRELAILLSEMCALAGWQSLDMGRYLDSWNHYEQAKRAAFDSESVSYYAHANAEQVFTLIDLGDITTGIDLIESTRQSKQHHCPQILRSWLAAAHGEALAAGGQHTTSAKMFDYAESKLSEVVHLEGPYVALDTNHLARWRGHATSQSDYLASLKSLEDSLCALDPTFTRAETALRVDMANALTSLGEIERAAEQLHEAKTKALSIGSSRQLKRIGSVKSRLPRPAEII